MAPATATASRAGAREARTAVRYLLAGAAAAAANYGSRFAFSVWLPFEAAVGLAAAVGTLVAFLLMRRFVFAPGRHHLRVQLSAFAAISAASAVQTLLVSSLLVRVVAPALELTHGVEAAGHLIGIAFPALTSYFAHRWVTFR